MDQPKTTSFEEFLKRCFWPDKGKAFFIDPGQRLLGRPAGREAALKKILENYLPQKSQDYDDFSAFLWLKHFSRHKAGLAIPETGAGRTKRWRLDANDAKALMKLDHSHTLAVATAAFTAVLFLLSFALVELRPRAADLVIAAGDAAAVAPLKLAYCALTSDRDLCRQAEDYLAGRRIRPDKDTLASYIIRRQDALAELSPGAALIVSSSDLEGRVAGAFDGSALAPSAGPGRFSGKEAPSRTAAGNFLQKAAMAQKNLVLRIQQKLLEIAY